MTSRGLQGTQGGARGGGAHLLLAEFCLTQGIKVLLLPRPDPGCLRVRLMRRRQTGGVAMCSFFPQLGHIGKFPYAHGAAQSASRRPRLSLREL